MPTRTSRRPSDPALDAKARRLSDNLRRLHRLGQQANADRNDLSTDEFAAEHGLNANTMRKARAFARAYSKPELEKLCRLRRPNGLPLYVGYLNCLLSIPDKQVRETMTVRAAREGWLPEDLYAAIRRRYPRRCDHGRPLSISASPMLALKRLEADADRWMRRAALVVQKARTAKLDQHGKLSAREAAEVLNKLAEAAERAAGELQKVFGRRAR